MMAAARHTQIFASGANELFDGETTIVRRLFEPPMCWYSRLCRPKVKRRRGRKG
jgi:hypothetical protein